MGAEIKITFTYERLRNFCYWCGCIGHILNLCEHQYEPGFDASQDPLPYGPWLWATTPTILRTRDTISQPSRPNFAGVAPTSHALTPPSRGTTIFNYNPTNSSTTHPHPPPPRPSTDHAQHAISITTLYTILPPAQHIQPPSLQPAPSHTQTVTIITLPHTNYPNPTLPSPQNSLRHPPPLPTLSRALSVYQFYS
ncbi:hypothetical protein Salat_2338500 [Sesamum alatum]|uniref:Zinc knuckle CX2CX4HX4C domain-containing protein n=1 Tax=Sesamum alatum TaxID=300844 RepID=A0AAE1XWH0_9LAMI|nr:hypothetical protein Salat_2338500 [Sesamum alatum]